MEVRAKAPPASCVHPSPWALPLQICANTCQVPFLPAAFGSHPSFKSSSEASGGSADGLTPIHWNELMASPRPPHPGLLLLVDLCHSSLPLQAPGSGQRRCWLRGAVQRRVSPAQGIPVSGSKQRRCRCCSETSRGAKVGGRLAVSRGQCPSRMVLEAEAKMLWGRQGPQGDHSDQSLRGRRPRRARALCSFPGPLNQKTPVGRKVRLRIMTMRVGNRKG
jgi:hypothetical protein